MDQDAQGTAPVSSRCNIGCADNMVLISSLVDSLTRCFGAPLPSSGKQGHGKEDGVDTAATTPATGSEESGEDPRDRARGGTSRDVDYAKELAKARKEAQRPSKHQRRLDALAKAERLKADIFRAKDGSGRVVGATKRHYGHEARQGAGNSQRGTTNNDAGGAFGAADGMGEGIRGAFCAAPRILVGNEGMARALCFANPIREEDDNDAFFGRSRNGARGNATRPTGQPTEEEKKIDDAMAAAAASGVELLEGETLEEALIRAEARGDCGDDQTQITQTTCEDTVTSTLYFDAKYGHVIESRPPMPLYRQFQVECSEEKPNELKRIIAGKTHSSRHMGHSIVPTDWSNVPWSEWGYQPARVVAEAFESATNAATAATATVQEAAKAHHVQVQAPAPVPVSVQRPILPPVRAEETIRVPEDASARPKSAAEAAVQRAISPIPPGAHEHLPVDDRGVLPVQYLEDEEDDYDHDEVDQHEQPQEETTSRSAPRDPEEDHHPVDDSIDTSMESSQAHRQRERGRRRTRKPREKGQDPPAAHRRHRDTGRPIEEDQQRPPGRSVRMVPRNEQNDEPKLSLRRRKQ